MLVPKGGNDKVYTPDEMALQIVQHFQSQIKPDNTILEPCYGQGAFLRAFEACGLNNIIGLELDKGQDFLEFDGQVDWIITNPPWSIARDFFDKGYQVADNLIWLITINHVIALKRRFRDMRANKFGVKEILMLDTPPSPWPQSGFQLGACHVKKGWKGKVAFTWN